MTREEAIQIIKYLKLDAKDYGLENKFMQEVVEAYDVAIEALEQKTGHWIYDKNIENWRCSKCGETPKTMGYCGTADFMAEHFKYCNHCGVGMVEPQEGGDQE